MKRELAILANYRVKIKEREKTIKYSDLARELKKPRNMRVTVISVVFCDF